MSGPRTGDADVVVIGAGPGGLAAAAYLAVCGRRVVLVDRREVPGGHQSSFRRYGCTFEIGLHYVTPEPLRRLLDPLGIPVEFTYYDPDALFTLLFPDLAVRVPRGMDAARDRLSAAFPTERRAVSAFLSTVDQLALDMRQVRELSRLGDLRRMPRQLSRLACHAGSTVGGVLDHLGASPRLRSVLAWNDGVFAVAPSRLSLLGYAQVTADYLAEGAAYPRGGSSRISTTLADVVRRHGGDLLLQTEATRILVTAGRVRGVEVRRAGGPPEEVLAPTVVAAGDLKRTILGLLPTDAVPPAVRRRVRRLEMALPLAVAHLVLDRDLRAEGFPVTNPIVFPDDAGEVAYAAARAGRLPDRPVVHLWSGTIAEPDGDPLCPPGRSVLELITVAPSQPMSWGVVPGAGPTARYGAVKRQVLDQLVGIAERAVPGLASAVVAADLATPLTDERLTGCTGGTAYGVAATPRQALLHPGPVGPVPGLLLAGASTRTMHGLVGGLTGGIAAAAAALGHPASRLGPLAYQLPPVELVRVHAAGLVEEVTSCAGTR